MNKIIGIFFLIFILSGCGSNNNSNHNAEPQAESSIALEDASFAMASRESGSVSGSGVGNLEIQDKIIVTGDLQMQAAPHEIDSVIESLRRVADEQGGYIERSDLSIYLQRNNKEYKHFSITLKIPSNKYKAVWDNVRTFAVVVSASERQDNVTQQYYDMQSRLETKRIEETRILELIERAETVEEILNLEQLLSEVRLNIEDYETQMKNIDRLTAYCTIHINLNEVENVSEIRPPDNIMVKIQDSFSNSVNSTLKILESIVLVITFLFVPFVVIFILGLVIVSIFRLVNKRKKNENAE